jgi:hypothetical protein
MITTTALGFHIQDMVATILPLLIMKRETRISCKGKEMEYLLHNTLFYHSRFRLSSRICIEEKGEMVYELKAEFKILV